MEKFQSFTARVMPLPMADVDTDQIIPAQFLTSVSRDGYGQNLFRRLRDASPGFPMNQDRFKGTQILAADSNFGCGSSREHAVWALQGAGFKAIIAKSFADIFAGNSAKNGLLLITLPAPVVDRILAAAQAGGLDLAVDLQRQEVRFPSGEVCRFEYDPFRRHCLLDGLDDIDYILAARAEISEFRRRQEAGRFFTSKKAGAQ